MKQKDSLLKIIHIIAPVVGAFIIAFGLFNVHSRTGITEGGGLGFALLLQHWFDISPSISAFVMDTAFYTLAFSQFGKEFLKTSITASLTFPVSYWILERVGYVLPDLTDKPLIAALVGAAFIGVGAGLVVMEGGASGGDDALALVMTKFLKCRISVAYLITDLTVLGLSLSYIPFRRIIFSLITVTLSSLGVELIQKLRNKLVAKIDSEALRESAS